MDNVRMALLIGGGSRVLPMLRCAKETRGAEVVFVLSCKDEGVGTESARENGVESAVIKWRRKYRKEPENLERFFRSVEDMLRERNISFVILAGWLAVMPQSFIDAFWGKIINIHPSILPKYPGNGEEAIRAQWEDELRRREDDFYKVFKIPATTGCTLHHIDAGVDTGRHIVWGFVDPRSCESESELAEAIHKKEDEILCEVIKMIAEGKI